MHRRILPPFAIIIALLVGLSANLQYLAAQASQTLTGTISLMNNNQLTLLTTGRTLELNITNNTLIRLDGIAVMPQDLKPGMPAIVFTDGKTATEVRATSPHAVGIAAAVETQTGTILQVGDNQITVRSANRTLTISLTGDTVIKVEGKSATAADLKGAMSVTFVTPDGKTATEVSAVTMQTPARPATRPTTAPRPSAAPTKPA